MSTDSGKFGLVARAHDKLPFHSFLIWQAAVAGRIRHVKSPYVMKHNDDSQKVGCFWFRDSLKSPSVRASPHDGLTRCDRPNIPERF